jgi:glyoxylate/hydroxypyruvate reductase A
MTKKKQSDNRSMRILFYATATKPEPWVQGLKAALPQAEVEPWTPTSAPADYAVVWSPPQDLLDTQPDLKAIFNIGAGVDALMKLKLPAQTQLLRLDDAGMSVQMAEYVCHAAIRHFREFDAYEQDIAEGRWSYRKPRAREDYPVGVMGLGVLGSRVARALRSFEFPVNGWSRSPKQVEGVRCFVGEAEFDDFLAATRILVCLVPLTPDTQDILNARTLGRLMPGGYLINVARGGHLVEEDLLALLDSGHLAGATIDVLRQEPPSAEHPFWKHPKITLTPHTSARTLRDETIAQIAGKILAIGRGEKVAGVVDLARGY